MKKGFGRGDDPAKPVKDAHASLSVGLAAAGCIGALAVLVGWAAFAEVLGQPDAQPGHAAAGPTSDLDAPAPVNDPEMEALRRWVTANGGHIDEAIEVRDGPRGRGVVVAKSVRKGKMLYKVTDHCWMSTQTMLKPPSRFVAVYPVVQTHLDAIEQMGYDSAKLFLTLAVEAEKYHPQSHWRPYLQALPATYPTQPMFWSTAELEALQSGTIRAAVSGNKAFVEQQYHQLMPRLIKSFPAVFSKANNTLASFVHSYYSIESRAFDASATEERELSLVPFVDLVNSEESVDNANTLERTLPAGFLSYVVTAPVELKQGEELLQRYRLFDATMESMYSYGFVQFDLSKTATDFIALTAALGSGGVQPVQARVGADGAVPGWLLSGLANAAQPALTLAGVALRIRAALEQEPTQLMTSLAADEAALDAVQEHGNAGDDVELVTLQLRVRFKRIFAALRAWLDQGIADPKLLERRVSTDRSQPSGRVAYAMAELRVAV